MVYTYLEGLTIDESGANINMSNKESGNTCEITDLEGLHIDFNQPQKFLTYEFSTSVVRKLDDPTIIMSSLILVF